MRAAIRSYIAATVAGAVLCLLPAAAGAEDKVLAKVNGKPITESDLNVAEADIGGDLASVPSATKRLALVEYLIDNQLFADAAEGEKLTSDPEFENRTQYWRQRILRELYFQKSIRNSIGDDELRKIYDEQIKTLKPQEEILAGHILVDTEDKAKELADKIAKGGDFGALAKENSKDTGSKDQGGMLDYFVRGQMVPQFEEAAFNLKKGDVSPPVQTQFGWHIIKIVDRRERQLPTFEEVKDRILNSVMVRKAQETATALRDKVQVEYVDEAIKKELDERKKALTAPSKEEPTPSPKE